MDWFDFIKLLVPIFIFFGSCFFWLWTRIEEKRKEDKTTFIDIYQKYNKLNEQIAFIRGKTRAYDDAPDTQVI